MLNLQGGPQELNAYLFKVRDAISATPHDLSSIKSSLVELLVYLSLAEARTSDNCTTTDTFFRLHDDYGFNWFHLPDEFQSVLCDMGSQLHSPTERPGVAANYECTPELLLERIHGLSCKETGRSRLVPVSSEF